MSLSPSDPSHDPKSRSTPLVRETRSRVSNKKQSAHSACQYLFTSIQKSSYVSWYNILCAGRHLFSRHARTRSSVPNDSTMKILTSASAFFTTSSMRNRIIYILGIFIVVLVLFMLIPHASATKEIDPDAKNIGAQIQQRSDQYAVLDKQRKPVLDQIEKLQAQADTITDKMNKVASGAAGLDQTLCNQYGLHYVRSSASFTSCTVDSSAQVITGVATSFR